MASALLLSRFSAPSHFKVETASVVNSVTLKKPSNRSQRSNTTRNNDSLVSSKLKKIYAEMRSRQLSAILEAGSLRSDPFFSLSQSRMDDERRCLAISAIIDDTVECQWTDAYRNLERKLRNEFSGLRFSQKVDGHTTWGQLHWTLMQLQGFADYEDDEQTRSREYLDCIQDSLIVGGMDCAIQITYIGVIVVSTGLLMVGIPSLDINEARDTLREKLRERNLPLKEPFVNDIVHSTLFRVTGEDTKGDMHLRLIKLAKEFENVHLGTVTLKKFQVGPASWRMLEKEVVTDTPPFSKWTLPDKNPREEYDDNLEINRNRFSVSGALGANLAKEIKIALNRTESGGNSSDELEETLFDGAAPSEDMILSDVDPALLTNAATLTGAGGEMLAQELQKQLQDQKRLLDSLYFTDYH